MDTTNVVYNHYKKQVEESTPATEKEYPSTIGMNEEQKMNFFVRHTLGHAAETLGKLNGIVHEYEHGGKLDGDKLKQKTASMFFTLFRLAAVVDLDALTFIKHLNEMIEFEYNNRKE